MKRTKSLNWKITVRPNKTGISVQTVSDVNDVFADNLSRVIEQSVLAFNQNKGGQ